MNYVVLHQSKYRLRLHLPHVRMDDRQADLVEYYLKSQPFIKSASVNETNFVMRHCVFPKPLPNGNS